MEKNILDLPIDEVKERIIEAIKTDKVLPELEMLKEKYLEKPMFGRWNNEDWYLDKQVFNYYFEYLDNSRFPFLEGDKRKETFIKKIEECIDPRDKDLFRGFPTEIVKNKPFPVDCFSVPLLIVIDAVRDDYGVYALECVNDDAIADMGNPELTNAEVRGMHPKKGANWDLLVYGFTGFYLVNRLSGKGLGRLFHEHFNACKDAEYKKLDVFERDKFNEADFARKYLEKEKINWKNCHLMDYLNPEQKERIELVWGELDRYIDDKIEIHKIATIANTGDGEQRQEPDSPQRILPTHKNNFLKDGEEEYFQMAIDRGWMALNDDGKTYTWKAEINTLAAFYGMFYLNDYLDNEKYITKNKAIGCKEFCQLFSNIKYKRISVARGQMYETPPKYAKEIAEMIKEARKQAEKKKQEQ